MKLFSYVVEHDYGFAPNPFFGVCSLAACKPNIRCCAQVGDYIIGTGCAKSDRPNYEERRGYLVYFMQITEVTNFDKYWDDKRFARKRPLFSGSKMLAFGDNIYHRNTTTGEWYQQNSFHSLPSGDRHDINLKDDTGKTDRVLLSTDFAYWGDSGPLIPPKLRDFEGEDVVCNRNHKSRFSPEFVETVVTWLRGLEQTGCLGRPANWREVA